MRPSHWPSTVALSGLLATILLLTVWAAGVYTLTLCIAATVLCLCLLLVSPRSASAIRSGESVCALLLLGLILWSVVPLPLWGPVPAIRAAHNQAAMDAGTAAIQSGLAESIPTWFSLTRNRAGTHRYLLMLIGAVAAAGTVRNLPGRHRGFLLHSLVALGAFVAVLGYHSQHTVPQGENLWWLIRARRGVETVGCFVNRNHFGAFVGMFAPVALVLLADSFRKKRWEWGLLHAVSFLVIGIAVAASKSRGAVLACGIGTSVTLIVMLARRRIVAALVGLALLGGVAFTIKAVARPDVQDRLESFSRLPETLSARLRLSTWKDATRIVADYPVMGVGANAFRMVFPQYRTASTRKSFYHAENEYIQIPVELGLAGTALLLGMLGMSVRTWRGAHRSGAIPPEVSPAIAGAAIVIASHAAVDFALRTPLYTITCACLWGMVLAIPEPGPPSDNASPRPGGLCRQALTILPACIGIIYALNTLPAHRTIDRYGSSIFMERAKPQELVRALTWSPTSWNTWYHLGRQACLHGTDASNRLCTQWITRAAEYNPRDYRIWMNLADQLERNENDVEGARRAYARARELRPYGIPQKWYEEAPGP